MFRPKPRAKGSKKFIIKLFFFKTSSKTLSKSKDFKRKWLVVKCHKLNQWKNWVVEGKICLVGKKVVQLFFFSLFNKCLANWSSRLPKYKWLFSASVHTWSWVAGKSMNSFPMQKPLMVKEFLFLIKPQVITQGHLKSN